MEDDEQIKLKDETSIKINDFFDKTFNKAFHNSDDADGDSNDIKDEEQNKLEDKVTNVVEDNAEEDNFTKNLDMDSEGKKDSEVNLVESEKIDQNSYYSQFPLEVSDFLLSEECRRDQKDWIESLPWDTGKLPEINMLQAEKILEKSHYGLNDVKQRIMEFISLQKYLGKSYGAILLLTGPPGVGKTSIAKSIAKAMERKFVKISLGGLSTALDIKGSDKTWKSAQPGLLIRALRRCGTLCPVILLDEIDKMGESREWGSPESVLIEMLDGERTRFIDSFLEVPVDLSNVVFIATANDTSKISPVLLDRMDVIELRGYKLNEKIQIARDYIIPYEMKMHRLTPNMLEITDNALNTLADLYAREPGVRHLQSMIKTICRKAVYHYVSGKEGSLIVDRNMLTAILGVAPVINMVIGSQPEVGVVNAVGIINTGEGLINPIEASIIPGDGDICYTGGMIDEVVESCEVAMSIICIRSNKWNLSTDVFDTKDIHIHALFPGIKKNGPSMGLALYTALVSSLLNKSVRSDIVMTGEITLRGKVMPVGMIEEKINAAYKAGMKTIIIPEGNRYHLDAASDEVLQNIEILFVSDVDQAIDAALI